jgi:hypothetical protein
MGSKAVAFTVFMLEHIVKMELIERSILGKVLFYSGNGSSWCIAS